MWRHPTQVRATAPFIASAIAYAVAHLREYVIASVEAVTVGAKGVRHAVVGVQVAADKQAWRCVVENAERSPPA